MERARTSWLRSTIAGAGAALMLYGGVATASPSRMTVEVPIQAFVFQPDKITVPVGTTVTWTNLDPVAHTVTDIYGSYDSGLFDEAASWSMTFTTPGTYTYYCIPHPTMIGTVEVQ